ncbi:hypothetical protein ETB97_006509 [Aspergillus alliaceus]|uniref:BTB domain-containing protein n=1 Tax=Petromyces alliaceus TaxID=209559 RepID=A0A5N7CSU8_PETAA|nr:hypothetical protein BDV23DRAFT_143231 [Aspergillus alliaceus]KAF5856928.1 hypothetical protein ETB97_006509 [Aspergillus burnettii]
MLPTKRTRTPPGNPDSLSSKYGAGKFVSRSRKQQLFRDSPSVSRRLDRRQGSSTPPDGRSHSPAVITLGVGPDRRLFAAHKDILCVSPFFATAYAQANPSDSPNRRINLPDEQPEIISCILEYLYKGDYYPRLVHNKQCNSWELEETGTDKDGQSNGATLFHHAAGAEILRDTAVYCAAEKYGLDLLKRLALRKQGLHSGIQCSTILTSARYAYSNTPDNESKLRAHYLALIIRSRSTFKRSGTMQMEMEEGGKLFFDLFVAMCNHMDDLSSNVKPSLRC